MEEEEEEEVQTRTVDMEVEKERPYVYEEHVEQVRQWIKEVQSESQFGSLYSKALATRYEECILKFIDHQHDARLTNLKMDKETVLHLHLIDISIFHKTCEHSFLFPPVSTKGRTDHLLLRCNVKEVPAGKRLVLEPREAISSGKKCNELKNGTKPMLLWTLSKIAVEMPSKEVPACLFVLVTPYLSMKESIAIVEKFNTSRNALELAIDTFIKREEIASYYRAQTLQNRKEVIMDILPELFYKENLIITIDKASESDWMKHLFTSVAEPREMLVGSLEHPFFDLGKKRVELAFKREVILFFKLVKQNDALFREQMQNNEDVFTNLYEYESYVTRRTDGLMEYSYARCEGKVVTIRIFLKSAYPDVERVFRTKRNLETFTSRDEDEAKITLPANKERDLKVTRQILEHHIHTEMEAMLSEERPDTNIIVEAGIIDHLAQRTHSLATTTRKGVDGALEHIRDYLNDTFTKASQTIEQETLAGDLSLSRGVHKIDQFDPINRGLLSPDINAFMQTPPNKHHLKEHLERRVSVSYLTMKCGDRSLVTTIVPCTLNNYTINVQQNNNNCIVYNTNNTNIDEVLKLQKKVERLESRIKAIHREKDPETRESLIEKVINEECAKKRKRTEPVELENIKRIRLAKEDPTPVQEEKGEIRIKYERVVNPDLATTKRCESCQTEKPLKSFYSSREETKKHGKLVLIEYLKNVCHSCTGKKNRLAKKERSLTNSK